MRRVRIGFVALAAVLAGLPAVADDISEHVDDRLKDKMRLRALDARKEGAMTWAEIEKEGRPAPQKVVLPPEGAFIGSGCYAHTGDLKLSGFCFTYWSPNGPTYDEELDLQVSEGLGNTLQWWTGGTNLVRLAQATKARGQYATCLGSNGTAAEIAPLKDLGAHWLGYDFGERYAFNFFKDIVAEKPDLHRIAEEYTRRVHNHVKDRHRDGWGNVMATSSNFSLDFEVAGGVEIPCTEDFSFGCLTLSSALGRGLFRQYDLPMWGTHLAHEWNSFLPHTSPYKMKCLETAFYLKYMTGAKLILNESGNWASQSNLCPDSPMSTMPILPGNPPCIYKASDPRAGYTPEIRAEAEKRFANIDGRSPVVRKYKKILADFYAYCKRNPCPKGQPEAAFALAKGNLDLASSIFVPNYIVGGAAAYAEKDMHWYYGAPERSWDVLRAEVMPQPPMFGAHLNRHFGATPYGLCDVVSFAFDNVTADHLVRNYRTLIFSGWNSCSEKQYGILCDYVKRGGRLVISLPHLSTNRMRNYTDYGLEELVNGGDFSALCGLKVVAKDFPFYWATGPSPKKNALGLYARRRFGIMASSLGKLEFTGPKEDYELLAVDDEKMRPVIVRCKSGKGEVFFVNTWCYPASANLDIGPGFEAGGRGLMSRLYAYVAKLSRGNTWITGPDFENPDEDCRWIVESYFPDAGKVCFLNLDYEHERTCVLHWFGEKDFITLKPGEFRQMDAPVLEAHEKLNAR